MKTSVPNATGDCEDSSQNPDPLELLDSLTAYVQHSLCTSEKIRRLKLRLKKADAENQRLHEQLNFKDNQLNAINKELKILKEILKSCLT